MEPTDVLSTNFRAYEFAQKIGQIEVLPDDLEICRQITMQAAALQQLRNAWARHILEDSLGGSPRIKIICGYRSPAHNEDVGGAPNSQHPKGNASDICCDVDWRALRNGVGTVRDVERMQEFATFCERYVSRPEGDAFGGFGIYTESRTGQCYWLHLDIRPRTLGKIAKWSGHHVGGER